MAHHEKEERVAQFVDLLREVNANVIALPGLASDAHYTCLAKQLWDSVRRIDFVHHLRDAVHDPRRADPMSNIFDPLRAAVIQTRNGNIDEAYWLVFLATHFGKHSPNGWRLSGKMYGKLGGPGRWDWPAIRDEINDFRPWLADNVGQFIDDRFSNHRKYESLKPDAVDGTAAVFESYVNWVAPFGSHQDMIREIHKDVGQDPRAVFDHLYRSMDQVRRFGRLGRFDYLTMLGKLGIAPIEPGSAYLWHNATGPKKGARLLFGGAMDAAINVQALDERLNLIDETLHVGMQALEDSVCNWQKRPTEYEYFKG